MESKVFLGVNRIRPGEISEDKKESLNNFFNLPVRFYDYNGNIKDNILGMAPNSPIWNYWKNLYHYPGKHINMTICYNENNEYVLFDSYINMEEEILFRVEKKSN